MKTFSKQCHTVLFVAFAASVFAFLTYLPVTAFASGCSETEIAGRFEEIASTYSVGEVLSEDDRAFVEEYGKKPSLPSDVGLYATNGSSRVNTSRTMYGLTGTLLGDVWHSGTFAYEWGATLTGRGISGPTPKKLVVSAKVQAYGLTGAGDMILQYKNTLSNTSYNSGLVQMSKSDSYSGLIVSYYVTSQLDVTTSSGAAFTVQSNW